MSLWNDQKAGPLSGVRVVDLSNTLMGPYCTLLLAQLGADVIKIEPPHGDVVRYVDDHAGRGMGHAFMNANRGKRSVVLDLKLEENRQHLRRLLATADVFCHNLRDSATRRLRLQRSQLAPDNERLISCVLRGFGRLGPYADMGAYDDTIQGASGLAWMQRDPEPGYIRSAFVDKTVGLMAVGAILAALYEREKSGLGQEVDVPMFESIVAMNLIEQMGGLVHVPQAGKAGYGRTASPHRRPFATLDGHISAVIYTDRHWRSFFDLIGQPELGDDPRYRDIRERTMNIDQLYDFVATVFVQRTTDEWLRIMGEADIPATRIMSLDDLMVDPQVSASGVMEPVVHPSEGRLIQPGIAWTFSRTSPLPAAPAPLLGQHTQEVQELLREGTGDR